MNVLLAHIVLLQDCLSILPICAYTASHTLNTLGQHLINWFCTQFQHLQQSLVKAEIEQLNHQISQMTPKGKEQSDLLTPNDCKMDNVFSTTPCSWLMETSTFPLMFPHHGCSKLPTTPATMLRLSNNVWHTKCQINTLKSSILQCEKEFKTEYHKSTLMSSLVSALSLTLSTWVTKTLKTGCPAWARNLGTWLHSGQDEVGVNMDKFENVGASHSFSGWSMLCGVRPTPEFDGWGLKGQSRRAIMMDTHPLHNFSRFSCL